jgi:hypothetical protein
MVRGLAKSLLESVKVKNVVKSLLGGVLLALAVIFVLLTYMVWMPNPKGAMLTQPDAREVSALRQRLRAHVEHLSTSRLGRNFIKLDHLTSAKNYIAEQFTRAGYTVRYNRYELDGDTYSNIIVDIPASQPASGLLLVGAHYDSVEGSPGANDNASGVAALIEIARFFARHRPTTHGIRLVAFVNEEPPFFQTDEMGSRVYARHLAAAGEHIVGMISLETIGYYSAEPGSQRYPKLFHLLYPDKGNFVAFVGNLSSRSLVTSAISLFRKSSAVPSEGIVAPAFIPGIAWSDQWSFWRSGYPAIMITDTAPYRYRHYHKASDTADKLTYDQYTRVVLGLFTVIAGLANAGG